MRQIPTTNDEPPDEDVERPRKYRYTLTDLLTLVTAMPVCIGVVAAVEFTAFNLSFEWFGIDWYNDVRHLLIDNVGVPSNFVARYVSGAMFDLPAWVCYAVIGLIFGLSRSKWSFTIAVSFILSIFVWDLMSDYFSGLHGHINRRLVSLFGVLVATLFFGVARKSRGRSHVAERGTGRLAKGFTCLALIASLGVSIYGWWLVDLDRKAGLEALDMFGELLSQ